MVIYVANLEYCYLMKKGPWAVYLTLGLNGGGGVGQHSRHQHSVLSMQCTYFMTQSAKHLVLE